MIIMQMWKYVKNHAAWPVWMIFIFLSLLHLYIPLVNHYNFKTFAYDYGVYNFAFYDFAHGRVSPCPVYMSPHPINFLQDHFSLLLLVLSPLYWLLTPFFGTYTLLILQWAFIVLGGLATYRLIFDKTGRYTIALAAMIYYFILYARFAAYMSDCNLMTMGAALLPVFMYLFRSGKKGLLFLCFLLLLLTREDFSLSLFFLCLTLCIVHRKEKPQRNLALVLAGLALLYFVLVFRVLIPLFETENQKFSLFNYTALGAGPGEALRFIIMHPVRTLEMFFVNHTADPAADGIKAEFYLVYLVSGGFILFSRPVYLLALIPLIAKKMLNDSSWRWGIEMYQSVEVASLLPVLVFLVISDWRSIRLQWFFSALVCLATLLVSLFYIKESTIRAFGFNKVDFLDRSFNASDYDLKEARLLASQIPEKAAVAASGRLLPALAFREKIFHFPYTKKAEYVFVHKIGHTFPFDQEKFDEALEKLLVSGDWSVLYESDQFTLLKRKEPPGSG